MAKKIKLLEMVNIPNLLTIANSISGMLAIFYAIKQNLQFAAIFLLVSVVFDFLDGKAARMLRTDNKIGKELDSLADIVSFGAAPAVFGFMIKSSPANIAGYIIFFIACITRLARFNAMDIKKYFIGTPVTLNGIITPIIYLLAPTFFSTYLIYIYIILAITMSAPIRIPKIG